MRILIVATKSPYPACDGGRLVLWHTLCGLAAAGHELAVVAPNGVGDHTGKRDATMPLPYRWQAVDAQPHGALTAAAHALAAGQSLGVARHASTAMRAAVTQALARWQPQVVHAEQLQALANCAPALDAGIPVVLRMQNVESAIRVQQARLHACAPALRIEAARLRADERRALARATLTVSLTEDDARTLRTQQAAARVASIAPAFPLALPAAPALPGDPAIALAGSTGWWPNTDGERWFLRNVWPLVMARLPRALLHRFGGAIATHARVQHHPAPADSQAAFPAHAIAVVPLRVGSGIRMRILEAWARGLPVVATPTAASGLAVTSGKELLIAETPAAFAESIARIHADDRLRDVLVESGRAWLRRHHDPARQTRRLVEVYEAACGLS